MTPIVFPEEARPDDLAARVQAVLLLWAAQDAQRAAADPAGPVQEAGARSGYSAASLLPYLFKNRDATP